MEADDRGGSNQHPALLEREDCTLVAWYPSLYAPRTGGAYDCHHRTAGVASRARRRGSRVAARGARATVEVAAGSVKMDKDYLVLKRASVFRSSGEWSDDDFDVLCDGVVVGRIMKAAAVPVGMSWMWTLAYDYHEDRTPTHGYEPTRDAAMAAFAKSWRRE